MSYRDDLGLRSRLAMALPSYAEAAWKGYILASVMEGGKGWVCVQDDAGRLHIESTENVVIANLPSFVGVSP